MQVKWTSAEAKRALEAIAEDIAGAFQIERPALSQPDYRSGRDWEWRLDTMEVWTKAGRAECRIDIDAQFAHLYFKFSDPDRAKVFDDAAGRLNRSSGKWNRIAAPADCENAKDALDLFRAYLRRDFGKVAEPNPPQQEVEAYRQKQAEMDAYWAACREESADLGAVESPSL